MYYPKREIVPGDWASFQCEIDEVIRGDINNQTHGREDHIMVCGKVPSLDFSRPYYILGELKHHPKYGDQYELIRMEPIRDLTDDLAQRRFLERILSDAKVNTLYEHLDHPYEVLMNGEFSKLIAIPGIGKKTAERMIQTTQESFASGAAYVDLSKYGLTSTMLDKLIKWYGSAETLFQKIQADPYCLANDVFGIGWIKADSIAANSGMAPNDPRRVRSYMEYWLKAKSQDGDTFVDISTLVQNMYNGLGDSLTDDLIRRALYDLQEAGTIYWPEDKSYIGLTALRDLEQSIANELRRLMNASESELHTTRDCSLTIARIEQEQEWRFVDEQIEAIKMARRSPVSIITGVAGSGKSSVVYGVLQSYPDMKVAQTALSGRAASRLGELTKSAGSTIHRLLEWQPEQGFACNKENPLPYDIIVLDEVSMVGAELFLSLLEAIPTGSKLIMLGDDGQLESIGLCNVFADMLHAGTVPVCRLTKIHRQAQRSAIKTEALKVRMSQPLVPKGWEGIETRGELQDLTLDIFTDSILTQDRILRTYREWIQQGINPLDIQVVVPMRVRGDISARALSQQIQQIVNPPQVHHPHEMVTIAPGIGDELPYCLCEGDLVIATVNNYKTKTVDGEICPVFNGNRGIISKIDNSSGHMIVDFEQWGKIVIPSTKWKDIELAYALTCHKLQGSEAGHVIVGLDYSGYVLLTKEWLYTAITRAQKRCTICAQSDALYYCTTHSNVPHKKTRLKEFLNSV